MIPSGILLVVLVGLIFLLVYGSRPVSPATADRLMETAGKVGALLILISCISSLTGVR